MPREARATLWVERSAQLTGFRRLSTFLLGDTRYAPYLFVLVVLFIDAPVLSTYNYVRGYGSPTSRWWQWPGVMWWLIPILVILGVFFLRTLVGRSHDAVRGAGKEGDEDPVVNATLSRHLQRGTLLLGITSYAVWLSTLIGPILQDEGPVIGGIKFLLFIPLVYLPIATDLAAVYVHIQLALPLRVRKANVPLDFSDPRHLGGLYSLGRVMWFAAVSVFVALTLYTILWSLGFVVDPEAFPTTTRTTVIVFFALAWSLATIVLVVGLYLIHQYMTTCREARLNQIHEKVRSLGNDSETLPYTEPSDETEFQVYLQEYVKLDRVERTRTFPFNIVVAWELVGAALIPVALQVLSIAL